MVRIELLPEALDALMIDFRRSPLDLHGQLAICARALRLAGFEGLRYYHVASETIPELGTEPAFFLDWLDPTPDGAERTPIGTRIEWNSASLVRLNPNARHEPRAVVESDYGVDRGTVDEPWVLVLGLGGKSWVDIPITTRRDGLVGLLGIHWSGPKSDLSDAGLTYLKVLAWLLSAEQSNTSPPVLADLQRHLTQLTPNAHSPSELVVAAALELQQAVRVASMSVFRYHWPAQVLVRESLRPLANTSQPLLDAEQFTPNEYLTGNAWTNLEYRLVLDFPRLADIREDLVEDQSFKYHKALVGDVTSVLYTPIGIRNQRFLLRLINNSDQPRLPFLAEREIIERFGTELSHLVDGRISTERALFLADLNNMISSETPIQTIAHRLADGLTRLEQLRHGIMVGQRGDQPPHFLFGTRSAEARQRLANDSAFQKLVSGSDGIHVLTLRQRSPLSQLVWDVDAGAQAALVCLFSAGSTQGALIFPLAGRRESYSAEVQDSSDTYRFIDQTAQTFGRALDNSFVLDQARGALNALSLVGHEMNTPIAAVRNLADHVLRYGEKSSRNELRAGERSPTFASDLRRRMEGEIEELSAAAELGRIVGRQGDGFMAGSMRETRIGDLLNTAINAVRLEIASGALLAPAGLQIRLPSGPRGTRFVCDVPMIGFAVRNLYRNAAKYSLPYDPKPAVLTDVRRLEAQGADVLEVSITNEGIHIPEGTEDSIFEAFVRHAGAEPDIGRRGMGLGLYLAQGIARAHGGRVALAQHVAIGEFATNDDAQDVYRTTFTLRLRTGLAAGPYRFEVKAPNGGSSGRTRS